MGIWKAVIDFKILIPCCIPFHMLTDLFNLVVSCDHKCLDTDIIRIIQNIQNNFEYL